MAQAFVSPSPAAGRRRAWRCCSTTLRLETPIAGFNGGLFVKADLSIIEQKTLPADVATKAIELIREHGLDAWVYRGNDWLITKRDAPHVAREAWTVKFEPKVVADFTACLDEVAKIVGISDDLDKVQRCEADAQAAFGQRATATRSQPYYLDVTHKDANKGAVVDYLSRHLDVPAEEIATLGDQPNDVLMFKRSGLSIAMGNASDQVKAQASVDDGFLQRRGVRQGGGTFHSRRVGLTGWRMGEMIGRIEVLPDPPSLARHVAEWMTTAAVAATGPFRVSLSGGSTPKTLYGLLASDDFRDAFPGGACHGTGAMSVSFPTIIRRATTG